MSDEKSWMQILADDNAAVRRDMRELEERIHERDLAVAALSQDRDEAYDRGVRDGIEYVLDHAYDTDVDDEQISIEEACHRAIAAYKEEVGRE